ncbi:penicillin-binding protein [Candidatus Parcubacteria bacterium]|nr:penicillin-binding protein [Candidatus Parcubacteria bacterium]
MIKRPSKNFKVPRPRRSLNKSKSRSQYITKKGNHIKLHSSFKSRWQAKRDSRSRKKAAYLASMPRDRFKRTLYRMHPKRVAKYWFSREGGIMALKLTGVGILAVFLLLVGVFAYFRKDLPNLRDISGNNIGGSIRYFDRTGKTLLWEDYDAIKRIPVQDENISQVVKDATIAIEDKDFFSHGGFDVRGIARAAIHNVTGNSNSTQGGSTITQQLVKLTQSWTKERTYTRKVKELILSVELERSYSKKEILAGYLNTAPYGDITYGVEAAMQDYFQRPASKITLDEAAFLAAIPKSPTIYSPHGARYNKSSLIGRQHYVLDLMAEQGKITEEERDKAKEVDTLKKIKPRQPKYHGIQAPWFVLTAKEKLIEERGGETVQLGGLKITTTLDLEKQKIAEEEVEKGLPRVRYQGGDTAAFVLENVKTGQVEALVGGSDFRNKEFGQNNYARLKLPPGSSFKPYDYISLIEHTDQFGAGAVLYDTPDPIPGYPCTNKARKGGNCLKNYDFRYPGPLTLRYALGGSRNVPAVKSMLIAGIDKTIETANSLGLKNTGNDKIEGHGYKCYKDDALTEEGPCYASSAIGDGAYLKLDEHVHAFSTISRNGRLIPQTYILKIEDAAGKVISEWEPSEGEQVVRPDSAYIVADIMSDPRASYFSRKSQLYDGHKFSMKTGTTNDSKDGWMMGFSTQYAAGVWVGYHNRRVEMSGFMERMTQPIWDGVMRRVHDKLEPEERPRPEGIQELPAFVVRNHVGVGSIEPSPSKDLFPSWYKSKTNSNRDAIIDRVSKKLATDCTPERAKQRASNAQANLFSGDKFHGGSASTNTSEKDDVHRCEDAKPAITLTADPTCDKSCTFTATVSQGTHPISSEEFPGTVNFIIGGNVVKSVNVSSSPSTVTLSYNSNLSGTKTVRAEIIDSVLYDASDSRSVTFKQAGGNDDDDEDGPSITSASWSDGKFSFTWSSNGAASIRWANGPNKDEEICNGVNSCTSTTVAPTGNKAYAQVGNAKSSDYPISGL